MRTLLREIVTDEVIARDRETGENFDEGVHLALGEAGYLAADFKPRRRGRLQSGAQAHLGSRDRPGAHALVPLGHNGHGGAGGQAVRVARATG